MSITLEQLLEQSLLGNGLDSVSVDEIKRNRNAPELRLVPESRSSRLRSVERPSVVARGDDFIDGAFESVSGTYEYRLYPPVSRSSGELALVVMLHGTGQDHVDFARGTRMHGHASGADTFVLYVAQSRNVPARSWNWFRDSDQTRGQGEPAIVAALTRQIVAEHDICPRRVYVAGLSAGAAMAVVLGHAYPDLFAAVGVHSGLPYGVASDIYSAFDIMARGPSATEPASRHVTRIPTIVFHGDADTTVHPANATAIVDDALDCCAEHATPRPMSATRVRRAGVRAHTATIFRDAKGRARVEQWIVHDAEHAWSGGSADGSHTDPAGPDATGEMLRFFQSHRLEPRCAG